MSINSHSSKLFKNNTKYNHELNIFDEFTPINNKDKNKSFLNNDLLSHIGNEQFKNNKKFSNHSNNNQINILKSLLKSNNNINNNKDINLTNKNFINVNLKNSFNLEDLSKQDKNKINSFKYSCNNSVRNSNKNNELFRKYKLNRNSDKVKSMDFDCDKNLYENFEFQAYIVSGDFNNNLSNFNNLKTLFPRNNNFRKDKSCNIENKIDKYQASKNSNIKNNNINSKKYNNFVQIQSPKNLIKGNKNSDLIITKSLKGEKVENTTMSSLKNKNLQLQEKKSFNDDVKNNNNKKSNINSNQLNQNKENANVLKHSVFYYNKISKPIEFNKKSSSVKHKKEKKGTFMLKKDYLIQNLIEKGTNSSSQTLFSDMNKNNDENNQIEYNVYLHKLNFDNEAQKFDKQFSTININQNYFKNNEFKLPTNILLNTPKIILPKTDPLVIKDNFSVRNFSNFKLIPKKSDRAYFQPPSKDSYSALSENKSNLNGDYNNIGKFSNDKNYLYNSYYRNCHSAVREDSMLSNTINFKERNIFTAKNMVNKLIDGNNVDNYKIRQSNLYKNSNKNSNNINYGKNFNLNENRYRELSAFTRDRKNKLFLETENDLEDTKNMITLDNKQVQNLLNPNILHYKNNNEGSKNDCNNESNIINIKPLLTKRPKISLNHLEDKIFSNELINDNFVKEKTTKIMYEVKNKNENLDLDKANQIATDERKNFNENSPKNSLIKDNLNKNYIKSLNEINEDIVDKTDSPIKNIYEKKLIKKDEELNSFKTPNELERKSKHENQSSYVNNSGSEGNFQRIKSIALFKENFESNNHIINEKNKDCKIKREFAYKIEEANSMRNLFSNEGNKEEIYSGFLSNKNKNNRYLPVLSHTNLNNQSINSNHYFGFNNSKALNLEPNFISKSFKNLKPEQDENRNKKEEENDKNKIKEGKEKDFLNEFLKSNPYLDSDHFNFYNTSETKDPIDLNNPQSSNITNNKTLEKKETIEQGVQIELPLYKNDEEVKKIKIENKSKNRNVCSSNNELKKKNQLIYNINAYLFSKNTNFQSLRNYSLLNDKFSSISSNNVSIDKNKFNNKNKIENKKLIIKKKNFNNKTSNSLNRATPNSFRSVFTPNNMNFRKSFQLNEKV